MEGGVSGINIPRNYFDLSQEHCFTMEAGLIYPIYQALLMPGDVIEVDSECVVRQMPTIVPSFSNFKMKTWDFVVAIRNLDKTIYRFLSGFKEYTSEVPWDKPLPKWIPSDFSKTRPGTLWDMLENPVNCIPREQDAQIDYFRQAYGYIWDVYFRNETRQDSILTDGEPGSWKGEDLLRVNWDRDFLTTSLPNQVLGEPLALPIKGIGNASFNFNNATLKNTGNFAGWMMAESVPENNVGLGVYLRNELGDTEEQKKEIGKLLSEANQINFDNSASILLSQLTEMLAIETMQTINALAGIRDDEFLTAHWGTAPSNEALQYPEIFGRNSMNIITSEVLQTAQDANGEGVGDMYGHGLGVGQSGKARFHCKEFSIYLKLAYIKPNSLYGNQGAKREYTQNTMYDFPFPELNHIAMQPIYKKEILCVSSKVPESTDNGITIIDGGESNDIEYNDQIAGYQPNYTWYTQKLNRVSGLLAQEQYYYNGNWKTKDNLYQWTEARFFSQEENSRPSINNDFLQCKIDNRNYQVVDDSVERSQFIVWHFNKVDAWRSLSSKRLPSNLAVTKGLA